MAEFRVTGFSGGRRTTIVWRDGGFADPTGLTAALIRRGAEVAATPTGPVFAAADQPAHVALVTARAALDRVEAEEVDPEIAAALEQLCAVPDGATA